ncbi:hypothetical protein D3C86_1737970 [compost metagenome]
MNKISGNCSSSPSVLTRDGKTTLSDFKIGVAELCGRFFIFLFSFWQFLISIVL